MDTKVVQEYRKKLSGNFRRMFFIQAFQNIRTINVVIVLFYLSRGLQLTEVFYLSIIWAVVNILFEVPSSYLADLWGRKRTIILGTFLYLTSCLWLVFADSFFMLGISVFFYALSNACFTGTDEALVYDTNRDLGKSEDSLKRLGQYYAAEKIFKVLSPLIGAILAKDLTINQFLLLLTIDISAALASFILSFSIVEPKRHFEVEKVESGIMRDAFRLIKNNRNLMRVICNRALGFISFFIIWRYHQEFFVQIGTPIIVLGIGWSLFHLAGFIFNYFIHRIFSNKNLTAQINIFNYSMALFLAVFIAVWSFHLHYYWLLLIYLLANFAENARWPIFADLINRHSNSFNRATTLSLSNLVKSIFDIPLLAFAGFLVGYNQIYPAYLALAIVLFASLFFYLPVKLKFENKF
jgi:MFS family permease